MKIERLPSGNYRIRVIIGHDPSGKPIRKSFTHPDKTKLRRIAFEYADTHRNTVRRYSISDSIDAFIHAKSAVLSPSTMRAYISMARTIKAEHEAFCKLYVDDISSKELQKFINELVKKGNTPKTVRNIHGFLSSVMRYSGERLPVVNLPQKKHPVINIPDEETIKRLSAEAKGTEMEIPLALAVFGLRRSEICALTPDDVEGNILHVHKAVVYGDDCQPHIKSPKTYSSDRYIQIPPDIAELIRQKGYVTKFTPHGLSHAFNRLLQKTGVQPYRLHDLRHFFVSYCHNVLKLSDAQIQSITGHKTSVVMKNYLHSMHNDIAGKSVSDSLSVLL